MMFLLLILISFISFVAACIVWHGYNYDSCFPKDINKKFVTLFILSFYALSIGLGVLLYKADIESSNDKKVTQVPIQEIRNLIYFESPVTHKLVELEGQDKFANPQTSIVEYTVSGGGWYYGIYVEESRNYKIVPKKIESHD